ncbi:alpha/beta hydrolase [Nonomuraea maheshkhaliensis]|uniref:alpha/beta hydrolase n=1 Tax=Nonomuraea maheshkhaliensis TaxID=419590 RepID=UPI0031F85412
MSVRWPAPATDPPGPLPAGKPPPYLGVGSWTDFGQPADIVRRVPGSAAIPYLSTGHGLYNSGIPCIIAHVNRYLISLRLPAPGAVCRPATRRPEPRRIRDTRMKPR